MKEKSFKNHVKNDLRQDIWIPCNKSNMFCLFVFANCILKKQTEWLDCIHPHFATLHGRKEGKLIVCKVNDEIMSLGVAWHLYKKPFANYLTNRCMSMGILIFTLLLLPLAMVKLISNFKKSYFPLEYLL